MAKNTQLSRVFLTPEQVADRISVNVETVRRWLRAGRMPGTRLSPRAWRISERHLAEWVKDHRVRRAKQNRVQRTAWREEETDL